MQITDQATLERHAAEMACSLRPGSVILLQGALGAGKTTFARALLRAACQDPLMEVPSPSYTLVQSYATPGGLALHHFDLWRLTGPESLGELGWEDAREGVVIVEWPDRLGNRIPHQAIWVRLTVLPDGGRAMELASSQSAR